MEGGGTLHTRKGWRGCVRPRGTNKRAKLTPNGRAMVLLSNANRTYQTAKLATGSLWGKLKGKYDQWIAHTAAMRIEREREEIAKALAAEQAAKALAAGATGA